MKEKIAIMSVVLVFCCACAMIHADAEKVLDVSLVSYDGADNSNLETEDMLDFLVREHFIPEAKAKDMLKKNTLATYFFKINFVVNVDNLILKDATVYATNANETEVWPSWLLLISSGGFRWPLAAGDAWQDGFWVKVNIEGNDDEEIEERIRATNFICEMILEDESGNRMEINFPVDMASGERSVYHADELYDCEYNQYMIAPTDTKIVQNTLGMRRDYEDIKVNPENYRVVYLIGSEFLKTQTPIYNLEAEGKNDIPSMWYRCLFPKQLDSALEHYYYDVITQKKRPLVTMVLFRGEIDGFEHELKTMRMNITFSMDGLPWGDEGIIAAGQQYMISARINDLTEIPYDAEYLQTLLKADE